MKENYCNECHLVIAPAEIYVKVSLKIGERWRWKVHTGCYRKFVSKKPDIRLHPRLAGGHK